MIRRSAYLLACLVALSLPALGQSPKVTTELAEGEVTLGQPVLLRIKLLVPTYMPDPPVWPDLSPPGVILRLPDRASTPVTERIDGQTWSGISRAYRLYPTQPGPLVLEGLQITATWADPDSNAPITQDIPVDPIALTVTVPDGALGLDPLIVAQGFTVTQEWDSPDDPQIGDIVTRRLTAEITGSPAVLIPRLIPATSTPALRAYPSDPATSVREDRGLLSGTREEATDYLLTTPGRVYLPDITLTWFNLENASVQEITLPGGTLDVPQPPAPPPDLRHWGLAVLGIGASLLAIWGLGGWVVSPLRRTRARVKLRWHGSTAYARRAVRRAIAAQDLAALHRALPVWWARASGQMPLPDALLTPLAALGRARFGPGHPTAPWGDMRRAIRTAKPRRQSGDRLAPLNPNTLE